MMDVHTDRRRSPKARNLKTEARFKRESWWQITFPVLAVAILLLGGVAALFFFTGIPGTSVTADYSIILMSIPVLVIGLVILVVIIALIYLVMLLIQRIPPYTFIVHGYFDRVRNTVVDLMGKITGALISFLSILSGLSLFLKQYSGASNGETSGPTEPGAGLD